MNVKKSLLKLLDCNKVYALLGPFYSGIGHVLIFHRVCPKNEMKKTLFDDDLEMTPEYFESVIKFFIEHNYEIISSDQLVQKLQCGKIDKKFIVITFDDGYADNLTYAYPILKKYNAPFTVYVTTGLVDRQAIMWWYLLNDLIVSNKSISLDLRGNRFQFDCSNLLNQKDAFCKISSLIQNSDEDQYLDIIKRIFNPYKIDLHEMTDKLSLTWPQIQELCNDPLATIGAHTISHLALGRLSYEAAKQEVLGSKKRLEDCLDQEIKHFSYPHGGKGDAEQREVEMAKECGFQTARTTRLANIFSEHKNHLMCLPGIIMIESLNQQMLMLLISGFLQFRYNGFKKIVTL